MAFQQQYIDRYKAQGFYKHVEWNRKHGVLVKLYDREPEDKLQTISFEAGTHDLDYDQRFDGYRAFFLTREQTVEFMINCGLRTSEIVQAFKLIVGGQTVYKHV